MARSVVVGVDGSSCSAGAAPGLPQGARALKPGNPHQGPRCAARASAARGRDGAAECAHLKALSKNAQRKRKPIRTRAAAAARARAPLTDRAAGRRRFGSSRLDATTEYGYRCADAEEVNDHACQYLSRVSAMSGVRAQSLAGADEYAAAERPCRTAERHCGGRPVGVIRLGRCGPGCQFRAGRLRRVTKSVWGGAARGQSRPVWADLRDHLHATATREKRPTGRGGVFRDRERIRSWAQAIARELVALPDVRPTIARRGETPVVAPTA